MKIQETIENLTGFLKLNLPARERQIFLFALNLMRNVDISNVNLGFKLQSESNESKMTYANLFDLDINSDYVNPDILVFLDQLFRETDYNIVLKKCNSNENLRQFGVILSSKFSYIVELSLVGSSCNQSSKIISINSQNSLIADLDSMDFDFYISSDVLSIKSSLLFEYNTAISTDTFASSNVGLSVDKQQIFQLSKDLETFNHLLYVIKTDPNLLT